MIKLIKSLYEISGSYSRRISKMIFFDIIKSIFEGTYFGAIMYTLMKMGENIFNETSILDKHIYNCIGLAILAVIGKIIFGYLSDRNKYISSYSLGEENRIFIGDRLRNVHMGYFSKNSLGVVAGGLSSVIGEMETIGIMIIEQLLLGTIQTIIMIAFLMPYDIIASQIVLITLVLAIITLSLSQKKEDALTSKLLGYKLHLNTKVLEYIKSIWVTKAFGNGENTVKELKESIENSSKGFLAVENTIILSQMAFLTVLRLGTLAIIITALMRFFAGDIDGVKAILLTVASFVVFSGFELAASMQGVRGVALQNMETLWKLRNIPVIDEGSKECIEEHNIELDNITFSYEENIKLFENLSLTIPEGETTALVGFSGSGKTTMCHLIARFWDVQSGKVTIGGEDVLNYKYNKLLSNFTFVFQDVYLFDDTIKNNIKFGKSEATDEEIIEIAKKAQCHEFIMKLPMGYDTVLQEGGSNLSGGEKQRISIARAMLKDSKFVILDEATSSVDPENERELMKALRELLKEKTTIVIAHRLSTVRNAKQIVVLKEGKIEAIGTHDKLMEQEGTYKDFIDIRRKSISWKIGS